MKIKHLLIGMLAVAAAVACKQDEPVETPKLDVDKTAVQVAATAGEASFSVTTNQDWTASPDADWVSVDPATGKGSEKAVTVKVTTEDNTSEEPRTAKITVKAGELTKTVAVTQAGATNTEPEPGPEPTEDTYILVGEAVGGWDVDANGVVLTLTDGYYVAKEVGVTANKGMHFTKNNKWEGNVKGLHGLIAPNEIGEVGTNDISLTEGGAFDVYLTEALDKFYFMTPGKTPEEAVEHVEIAVSWGMMGMFVDNEWGTDVPMTYEGEWIVAKGAQFSQLTFKIRGNGNWNDATNIGVAPGSEKGVVNGKIAVVTAEYSKANHGADAADIKLNGEAGTYDVYFSFDKLEVYVMEQGFKPGEKDPQNPEPVEVTYTVVGTLKDINWDNANPAGLMVKEGDYYVGKNVPFVTAKTLYDGADQIEFKVVETGTWDGYAHAQKENENYINGEIPVQAGGENIIVKGAEGNYDVYFDKANLKVWVMEAGFKPGEKEPVVPQPEPEYTIDHKQWIAEFDGMPILIDLDLVEEGAIVIALPLMSGDGFGMFMSGMYEVAATDAKSGVLKFAQYDAEFGEFLPAVDIAYSNLAEKTVDIVSVDMFGTSTPVAFTLVENPYEIELEAGGPSGEVEDGVYWFIEPTNQKVMTPLDEGATYGRMAAANAIDGASTAKNAFTLTYNADWSCYTIQDSYGRYLYQGMQDDGATPYRTVSLATSLPAADDENMAYYMWTVYGNGDGTYDVYNSATYYSITYSPSYNNWEIYDPYEPDFANLFPSLVKADNPVEEPALPSVSGTFVKVAAEQEDWSGKYLIVFDGAAHASLTNKDLNKTADLNIVNDEVEATDELSAAVMTVTKSGDVYHMTFADGSYFGMQHNGCKLMTSAFDLGFEYTADGVKVSGYVAEKSNTYILYHNSNNGDYYRCYVDKDGQSGYTLPTLYKLAE